MFKEALLPDTLRALKLVSENSTFQRAYLAGGTSLALQLGHRISLDLDFFTLEKFDAKILAARLKSVPSFNLEQTAPLTLLGKIGETRLSIFTYPYKVVGEFIAFEKIKLADKKDVAAMKIHALEDRGAKRDFIDLYFLTKSFGLDEMIGYYDQKYACLEDHLYSILKSLNYFADAEMDTMPKMLTETSWAEVKNFFRREAIRLSRIKL